MTGLQYLGTVVENNYEGGSSSVSPTKMRYFARSDCEAGAVDIGVKSRRTNFSFPHVHVLTKPSHSQVRVKSIVCVAIRLSQC